jgi:hypothetical protein
MALPNTVQTDYQILRDTIGKGFKQSILKKQLVLDGLPTQITSGNVNANPKTVDELVFNGASLSVSSPVIVTASGLIEIPTTFANTNYFLIQWIPASGYGDYLYLYNDTNTAQQLFSFQFTRLLIPGSPRTLVIAPANSGVPYFTPIDIAFSVY